LVGLPIFFWKLKEDEFSFPTFWKNWDFRPLFHLLVLIVVVIFLTIFNRDYNHFSKPKLGLGEKYRSSLPRKLRESGWPEPIFYKWAAGSLILWYNWPYQKVRVDSAGYFIETSVHKVIIHQKRLIEQNLREAYVLTFTDDVGITSYLEDPNWAPIDKDGGRKGLVLFKYEPKAKKSLPEREQ
jgi:hypothetical protein